MLAYFQLVGIYSLFNKSQKNHYSWRNNNMTITTFTLNEKTYAKNDKAPYYTCDGKSIKKADFEAAEVEAKTEADLKAAQAKAPETPAPAPAPEKDEAPAEKKEKTHPTADKFLATIPEGYIFKVNNKGHIRVFKSEDDKDGGCYCKLNPLKDGVWVLPRKDLKAARPDIAWEEKEGWSSKYAYKAKDWNEAKTIIFGA